MKKISLILIGAALLLSSCNLIPDAFTGATKNYDTNGNSLYHRTDETSLATGDLFIEGEVKNPGEVKLKKYYKREVFYKQATPNDSGNYNFVGAYRYRGYSLFDILNPFIVEKKNVEAFRPSTDLYIIIENDKGDKVTFSWAEIFLTNTPHQVIIATEMAPIKPYKKEVDYPTGKVWKIVAANDLFAFRELENPTKITIKSFDKKEYEINRELKNPFTPTVNVVIADKLVSTIDSTYNQKATVEYKSIFYGMGMGYHASPTFKGVELMPIVDNDEAQRWMQKGLVCFAGLDGYRVIYSYSELFNRVDQVKPILAIPDKYSESGYFRIYHPSSFYADMSAKALAEIYLFEE